MNLQGALFVYGAAHRDEKNPLFFSQATFQRMKERGNTQYCFLCGGDWGFTPDAQGNATNQMNPVMLLEQEGSGLVTIRVALANAVLRHYLAADAINELRDREHGHAEDYVAYYAPFDYTPEFASWCRQHGYRMHRNDPMRDHDPRTHAQAVVGCADQFDTAEDWLKEKLPTYFPFLIAVM